MMISYALWKKASNSARFAAVFLLICFIITLSSCSQRLGIHESVSDANDLPQPNPYDGISFITKVKLYYRFLDSSYLLPFETDVKIQSNEMEEAAVLRALIAGSDISGVYTSAIPKTTELVSIMENGATLYVTLNKDFIDNKNYDSTADKRVAVCEILNTLTNYSNYSVQILIDTQGNGIGQKVSYADLGFDSSGKNNSEYATSFIFTKSMVATPDLMFSYCMEHLQERDFDGAVAMFTAPANRRQLTGADLEKLFSNRILTSFDTPVMSQKGSTVSITTSITFTNTVTDETLEYSDITIDLVSYGEVYKIPFNEFADAVGV